MRSRSRLVVVGLLVALFTALPVRSAVAAETILYDVTRIDFTGSTGPMLSSTGPVRAEIIDNGPGTSPDPRWQGSGPLSSLLVWDIAPTDVSDQDARVFGHHCVEMGDVLPHGAVARKVEFGPGGGTFAWMASSAFSPDGVPDPYAFFCLKGTHQSTSAWSEWILIGTRVRATQPPPPAQQVTIALSTNQTVSRSTPIKVSATGFAAGPLRYFISIDNVQKWSWYTTATTITQYWGTTTYPNGTHSVTVRVTDSAGKTATSTVNVLVRN